MVDDGRNAGLQTERRDARDEDEGARTPQMDVRDEDLEPHAGLRYIARMFKILALLLILLLAAEIVIGLVQQGNAAIPRLLIEATRLIVFAGLLWGAADMGLMLIESNHDLRATRILVGRLNNRVQKMEQIAHTLQRGMGPQSSSSGGHPPPSPGPRGDPRL